MAAKPVCKRPFVKASVPRPQLHRMLDPLRDGDTVVVWKLDRSSRSPKDVLHIMERIAAAGMARHPDAGRPRPGDSGEQQP